VARRFKLTPPRVPEFSLQKQIADTLAIEIAPAGKVSEHGVVWWSVDVANHAGEVPGIRMGRGIIAGIPDMLILHLGAAFMVEIKAPDGELTEPQRGVLAAVLAARGRVAVARDAWEVLAILDYWKIPRARRVREAA
jgi:hypothetical protein